MQLSTLPSQHIILDISQSISIHAIGIKLSMADEVDPPGNIMAPKIQPADIGSKLKREYIDVDGWKWCKQQYFLWFIQHTLNLP